MGQEYKRDISVIATIPRLGPIELFDDMEDLLKWSKSGTGADYNVTKDGSYAYNGNSSLKLVTRATGPAEDDFVAASRSCFQIAPGIRSVELIWMSPDISLIKYFTFDTYYYDGTNVKAAGLRYDVANQVWKHLASTSGYSNITGGDQNLMLDGVWHRALYQYDRENTEYVKVVMDNLEVDLSGTAIYSTASANPVRHLIEIGIQTAGAAQATAYIDEILIKVL